MGEESIMEVLEFEKVNRNGRIYNYSKFKTLDEESAVPYNIKNVKSIIVDIEKELAELRYATENLVSDILESVTSDATEDDIVYVKNVMHGRIYNVSDITPLPYTSSKPTWFSLEVELLRNKVLYINLNNIDTCVKALECLNKIKE
jgi:hypothetical protein